MGPQEDYIETVVTCEGDYYDPEFHTHLQDFSQRLQNLLTEGHHQLIVKKVEPWNSVRVTFNIPKDAAVRLKQLAEQGDSTLRDLGVLAVQIEGDRSISLTIAGKNNETTELVLRTTGTAAAGSGSSVFDLPSSDDMNIPGPSNVESTRRNIVQYLREQGGSGNLFDSILNPALFENFKPPDAIGASGQMPINPFFAQFPFGLPVGPGHSPGSNPQSQHEPSLPFGFPPGSFPSSSQMARSTHTFSSPAISHNQSSMSPNYPTPPPSVSNPSSPGSRTANHAAVAGTSAALNNLPRLLTNRDITSSSPLLVNLLQNDIGGLAHLNNLMPNKMPGMPFHLPDMNPPPVKRKRKPRKPKNDAGKARSPAGQESLPGALGGMPPVPGFNGGPHNEQQEPSTVPAFNLLDSRIKLDTSRQSSQEMELGNNVFQNISSAPSGVTCTITAPSNSKSPIRMHQSPLRNCQSPGQAVSPRIQSPRAQSPAKSQSPVRSQSPGRSKVSANNPPHIVNPVTGQLEPASNIDMQQRVRGHVVEEGSLDSDDMAQTQLRPPPNPLVELKKDMAASTETNMEVPGLSMHTHKQSSPRAFTSTTDSSHHVDAMVKSISERCLSLWKSGPVSASVTSTGTSPSMELVRTNVSGGMNRSGMPGPIPEFMTDRSAMSTVASNVASGVSVSAQNVSTSFMTSIRPTVMNANPTSAAAMFHASTSLAENPMFPAALTSTMLSSTLLPPSHAPHTNLALGIGTHQVSSASLNLQHTGSRSSTGYVPYSTVNSLSSHSCEVKLEPSPEASTCTSTLSVSALTHQPVVSSETSSTRMCFPKPSDPVIPNQLTTQSLGIRMTESIQIKSSDSLSSQRTTEDQSSTTMNSTSNSPAITSQLPLANSTVTSPVCEMGNMLGTRNSLLSTFTNKNRSSVSSVCESSLKMDSACNNVEGLPMNSHHSETPVAEEPVETAEKCVLSPRLRTLPMEENSNMERPIVNCNSPATVLLNATPEHEQSGTDGSDSSSLVAHSQGKDSGIADVGHNIIEKINCISRDDAGSDTQELGRSNGASVSEASPLSEADTVSSSLPSRSPSGRSASIGLANQDSELSSHSFEDHPCTVSLSHTTVVDRVPKFTNATNDHGKLNAEIPSDQTGKPEIHKCNAAAVSDSKVITVGYALSKEQPSLDPLQCGLNDRSLPFLTKPSNVFSKDSSSVLGLKEFTLEDHFHDANNIQRTKKNMLQQSTLSNGEDNLNWSKTLKLSPKLLGKSDLNQGDDGDLSVGTKISIVGINCAQKNSAALNGDRSLLHEHLLLVGGKDVTKCVDTAVTFQNVHPAGLPAVASIDDTPQLETGLGASSQVEQAEPVGEESMDKINSNHSDKIKAFEEVAGNEHVSAASPHVSSVSVELLDGSQDSCAAGSTNSSSSTYSPTTSTPTVISSPPPVTASFNSTPVSSTVVTSNCTSSTCPSLIPDANMSDVIPVTSLPSRTLTPPVPVSQQDTAQTNTFGASMVTTIVTSASSMGSVLTTSFSMMPNQMTAAPIQTQASMSHVTAVVTTPQVCVHDSSISSNTTSPTLTMAEQTQAITSLSLTQNSLSHQQSTAGQHPSAAEQDLAAAGQQSAEVSHRVGSSTVTVETKAVVTVSAGHSCVNIMPNPLLTPVSTSCIKIDPAAHGQLLTGQHESLQSVSPNTLPNDIHSIASSGDSLLESQHKAVHEPLVPPVANCVTSVLPVENHNPMDKITSPVSISSHNAPEMQHKIKNERPDTPEGITTSEAILPGHNIATILSNSVKSTAVGTPANIMHNDSLHTSIHSSDGLEQKCMKDKHSTEQEKAVDSKPSRGISIMKPLYDRDWELEEELHDVSPDVENSLLKTIKSEVPVTEELKVHTNQVSSLVMPKAKSSVTVAQILEEADKQRRNHMQIKPKGLLAVNTDIIKSEIPVLNDSVNKIHHRTKANFTGSNPTASLKAPVDLGKNTGAHFANFVQKSLQTPVLFNSTPHPITSPAFPLDLTESVKKVMNAIPRTDSTPPPSPMFNKGSTSLPTSLSPSRLRAKSISPVADGSASLLQIKSPLKKAVTPPVKQEIISPKSPIVTSSSVTKSNNNADNSDAQNSAEVSQLSFDNCVEDDCSVMKTAQTAEEQAVKQVENTLEEVTTKSVADGVASDEEKNEEGDDSFNSEHSYSARPKGDMDSPVKDQTIIVSQNSENPDTSAEADQDKPCKTLPTPISSPILTCQSDTPDTHTSGYVSPVSLDEVVPVSFSPPLPIDTKTTISEGAAKTSQPPKFDGKSKIQMISPNRPIITAKDDGDGSNRTLVIKIVGAHATPKETVSTTTKPEAKISPSSVAALARESSVIDLSTIPMYQKPANSDLPNKVNRASKRKSSSSDVLDSSLENEHKMMKTDGDSESVRSISPVDLGSLRRKRRSPSIDALSETSSIDGCTTRTRSADNFDRSESPALRPQRMSTRILGRRRNSPSESSTDGMSIKDEKPDHNIVKPVATRGSKRRLQPNHDADANLNDKKIKLDLDLKEAASDEDAVLIDSKNKGNSVSTTAFYQKSSAKTIPSKGKVNNMRAPTPPATEEKQKGKKALVTKVIEKEEPSGNKRGPKPKAAAETKEDGVLQGKGESKDDATDSKGKRTTRSSGPKLDHCELPCAAHTKRRRSSRDHR